MYLLNTENGYAGFRAFIKIQNYMWMAKTLVQQLILKLKIIL
ncbi:hypothetical protein ERICIV_02402 [Paenibacillus larvae subsp. larvae]|uniref:Uncharacterized protein n=1 Tax=Paenibacillus larvae subsp. larvae TaxID=147375 RepID=A0A2L1UEH7_9BACL|nr:hypothetical protein ERICIII_02428 [Paenibacillus larvae subsp. larvae]AVF31314.1 hypothetical protein ERICIV_02402 [Paenibacillus larvae subsp. larvae]